MEKKYVKVLLACVLVLLIIALVLVLALQSGGTSSRDNSDRPAVTRDTTKRRRQRFPHPDLVDDHVIAAEGTTSSSFDMFSGYLEAGDKRKKVFYWLNEVELENESRTLLVWFNGGPGCSSLFGLFQENGPYLVREETGEIERNEHSWNRFYDVLYIEAPLGVGFSKFEGNGTYENSDESTTDDMLAALENFVSVKHPKYSNHTIYLTGESYAGIYLPLLANKIFDRNSTLARLLKGIAIGNPLLNVHLNRKTLIDYVYHRGFIDWETKNRWSRYDCYNQTEYDEVYDNKTKKYCDLVKKEVALQFDSGNILLNPYDYNKVCWKPDVSEKVKEFFNKNYTVDSYEYSYSYYTNGSKSNVNYVYEDYDYKIDQDILEDIDDFIEEGKCEPSLELEKFMNKKHVQKAFHADEIKEWTVCNYDVLGSYRKQYEDVSVHVSRLLKDHNIRFLLYFGDQDLVCNFHGGEEFVKSLHLKKVGKRKPFIIRREDKSALAAHYDKYEEDLAFVVVKGAGHMVPSDKPEEMLALMRSWIDSQL